MRKSVQLILFMALLCAPMISQTSQDSGGKKGVDIKAVPSIAIDDSLFGGTMFPSLIGYEFTRNNGSNIAFSIFQGFPLCFFYLHDDSLSTFTLKFAYHGVYDFVFQQESGPLVSRVQNPMVYGEVRFKVNGNTFLPLYLGWAHESNGMYLQTKEQAKNFLNIQPTYDPQDYASMGWDYLWFRLGSTSVDRMVSDDESFSKFSTIFEYRYHVKQISGYIRSEIEDTSIFFGTRPRFGIQSIDGTRLSFSWSKGANKKPDHTVLFELMHGEFNADYFKRLPSLTLGYFYTVHSTNIEYPFYVILQSGYKHRLSNYYERMESINIGVALPTEGLLIRDVELDESKIYVLSKTR